MTTKTEGCSNTSPDGTSFTSCPGRTFGVVSLDTYLKGCRGRAVKAVVIRVLLLTPSSASTSFTSCPGRMSSAKYFQVKYLPEDSSGKSVKDVHLFRTKKERQFFSWRFLLLVQPFCRRLQVEQRYLSHWRWIVNGTLSHSGCSETFFVQSL